MFWVGFAKLTKNFFVVNFGFKWVVSDIYISILAPPRASRLAPRAPAPLALLN